MVNLVTGATGLVGSNLCRYLIRKGETVYALHRKSSRFDLLNDVYAQINWIEGDLQDISSLYDICQKTDFVYHVAAKVSYQKNEHNLMYACNVKGTQTVVNAALAGPAKNIIDEQNEPESWNSKYGHSKYLGELEVWRAQAEGMPTVIVNPSVIIGGGYWSENSGKLFTQMHQGFPYYSKGATGFVDVRDVVKIMHQLMHSTIEEERFLVSAENRSYKNLFEAIAQELNVKAPNKSPNKHVLKLALFADWWKSKLTNQPRFLTRELIETANITSKYGNNKLTGLINYNYIPLRKAPTKPV